MFRVGLGSDIHKFESGRKLWLGGVEISHDRGLAGHSDADVVLHAIGDALLGASGMGDLGEFFPGNDENKDRASSEILHEICLKIWNRGFKVMNCDVVIMTEEPKIASYRPAMVERIAGIINVEPQHVGVKATTCEGLGAIGRSEGIFAQAVVLLEKRKL